MLAPVVVTCILVTWTFIVYPLTNYGDWEVYPALFAFPAAIVWHMAIIYKLRGNRKMASLAALGHLGIMFTVWLGCLMAISKDSL